MLDNSDQTYSKVNRNDANSFNTKAAGYTLRIPQGVYVQRTHHERYEGAGSNVGPEIRRYTANYIKNLIFGDILLYNTCISLI